MQRSGSTTASRADPAQRSRPRTRSAPDRSRESGNAPGEKTRDRRARPTPRAGRAPRAACRRAATRARPRPRTAAAAGTRPPTPRGIASSVAYTTGRSGRPCRTPFCASRPSHHTGCRRDVLRAPRDSRAARAASAVSPGCARAERELGALDVGVGREIAFAARERMVAGPERHAALRGDQHEAVRRREGCGPSTARRRAATPTTRTAASAGRRRQTSHSAASGRKNSIAGRTRMASAGRQRRARPPRARAAATARRSDARGPVERRVEQQRRRRAPAADRALR